MQSLLNKLPRWLDRVQPSESVVLGSAALLVGLTTGLSIWIFKGAFETLERFLFEDVYPVLATYGVWTILFFPTLGGAIVGLLTQFFIVEEKHHGVAGIMEAVALGGGRLRYWRIPAKALAAILSIGFGASVGPEDPAVQIGGNLGSFFGQWWRLSDERLRTLVAAGVAAGVASAFNAPITGVFFAIEIVVGELSGSLLGVVLLTSVTASVVTQSLVGPQPAFSVPAYAFQSLWELPLYLGLGVLIGPLTSIYVDLLDNLRDRFHAWAAPRWFKPIVAGALVGIVAIWLPAVLGVGYSTIDQILNGQSFTIGVLLALTIAKLIFNPVSLAGGFQGGVFAPSLFMGATLGAAYGLIGQGLFPSLNLQPAAFAMVGMAAFLAGVVHAPLTAIIMLFEITHDYRIILPLMLAVTVSLMISRRIQKESIYVLGLAKKGIRLDKGRDVEVLESLTVDEVMQFDPVTLHDSQSLADAVAAFSRTRLHGLAVINQANELVGVITLQDIERVQTENSTEQTVGQVCSRELVVAFPDESIGRALRRMSVRDIGRLPVVSRQNPQQLLGMLGRADLVRAYDTALTRRETRRHQAHQVRLGAVAGVDVLEVTIEADSHCVGRSISQIAWPPDCIIATIRRGRQIMVPRGTTVLAGGDVLAIVAEGPARAAVLTLCQLKKNQ
jgi:CIC family chloride channel protein